MKKTIIIMTVILLCLAMVACSKTENTTTYESTKSNESPTTINESQESTVNSTESTEATEATTDVASTNPIGSEFIALIPEGWKIFEKVEGEPVEVEGDLNKDGISDIAAVIVKIDETTDAPQRSILIALGNSDNTYTLSVIGENAILGADEGGVWGDPFDSIVIDRGSIVINFYGGSNWRWYQHYRFRYQDNGWFLIGATLGSYFNTVVTEEDADEDDYNLLTGDFISKKTDEQGNQVTTKGNRGINPLLNLKDFRADSLAIEKEF